MPELPEVETTRRGITPHVRGATIETVEIRERRLRWPVSPTLENKLAGETIVDVQRRAKYLLLYITDDCLLIHLGMSGSLRLVQPHEALLKHDHLSFSLNNGKVLRYNDPRRFGCVMLTGDQPLTHKLLCNLGPEPLDTEFDGDYLFARSRGRNIAVKNFIMDNHIVVGVGNIYANEALFLSGIRPRKAARRVTRAQYQLLASNIVAVLKRAIDMGGTTLRDFVGGDGKPGYFQQTLNVYDRAGQRCPECKTAIKHCVVGQRSSYYCPDCQQ